MSAPELKSCPFCGSRAHITREPCVEAGGFFAYVQCGKCRAKSPEKYYSAGNDCPQLYAEIRDTWNARADLHLAEVAAAYEAAADRIDIDIKKIQPEMTRRAQRLADGKKPGFNYAIQRADLDARMSCRDQIRTLAPSSATAAIEAHTARAVQEAVAKERERCAGIAIRKIARALDIGGWHDAGEYTRSDWMREHIAAAIMEGKGDG